MNGYATLGKLIAAVEITEELLVALTASDTVEAFAVVPVMNVVQDVIVVIPDGGVKLGVMTTRGLPNKRPPPTRRNSQAGPCNDVFTSSQRSRRVFLGRSQQSRISQRLTNMKMLPHQDTA